jgi:hypothetical protein
MRKSLFFFLLTRTIFGCGAIRAQETTKAPQDQSTKPFSRWSVDALAGAAIPVGAFGSLDHQYPSGGPIQTGGLAEVSGTYHLNRSFGVVLLAGGQINKGNGINYVQPPAPLPPGALPGDALIPIFDGSRDWMIARFLTGGVYTLPLNRKNSLDLLVRVLGGVQKTKPADYSQNFDQNENRGSWPYISLPPSFSYQADAGLKWQQQDRIALIAYAGYSGSESSRELTYLKVSDQGVWTYYPVKAKIPTGSLLFRAGIEIGL